MSSAKTSPTASWSNDIELLDLVQLTLQTANFNLMPVLASGLQAVRADDRQRVIFVSALVSIEDLLRAETALAPELVTVMSERSQSESRRVEGYLVLLSTQDADVDNRERIFDLTYDLRYIRRLIRVAVQPTPLGVARALRPILPLIATQQKSDSSNALEELVEEIRRSGTDAGFLENELKRFAQHRREIAGDENFGSNSMSTADELEAE